MNDLQKLITPTVEKTNFSGVIFVKKDDTSFKDAFGYRDRANQIKNGINTRFGIASGTKGFTALGIAKLIEEKKLTFDTPIKSILDSTVKNLHPNMTIRHLLGHTSGVGDYFDEENVQDINEVVLSIPVQHLVSPLDYIPLIEAEKHKFSPGERFSYSNSGYILLAMIIEIVSSKPYQDYIETNIFALADMSRSGFFRSDELPADTAIGYIQVNDSWRSNVFHLPLKGGGDGGAYSTVEDMEKFWHSLKTGCLLQREIVFELLKPREYIANEGLWYGYGFWIDEKRDQIVLEGYDAGVSFRSVIGRECDDGYTIISNTSFGVWSLVDLLNEHVFIK